jgi:putative ABC transport system permease protein
VLLRVIGRSLARRGRRKLAAVVAVWVGLSLVVALLALSIDVSDRMQREVQAFGANIHIEAAAAAVPLSLGGNELPLTRPAASLREADLAGLRRIFWRNNILGVVARLDARGEVRGQPISVLGVWIDRVLAAPGDGEPLVTGAHRVYRHWRVAGRWPKAGEALAGARLAERLGLSPGQPLAVAVAGRDARLRVSGVLTTGEREDEALVLPLAELQGLLGLPGRFASADVAALTTPENHLAERYRADPASLTPAEYERWSCTPYPGVVAADVQKAIPGSVARVVRRVAESQGLVLTRLDALMVVLALLTLLACVLSVAGVLAAAVQDRRTEIALLQALGAERGAVVFVFLAEAAILGLAGGLLAAGSGSLLAAWLERAVFAASAAPHLAPLLLAPPLGLAIVWAGSAWPVWRALHERTALVLHGG